LQERGICVDDATLHVAINAQLVSFSETYRNAGVSRYTYSLLDGLSHANADLHYTAFVNGHEAAAAARSPLSAAARLRLVPSAWPTARPPERIFWEQVALPWALRQRKVDVFHSPVNVLPRGVPCASVVTVHDLAFIHYPHYFRPARRLYQRVFTVESTRAATLVVAVSESTKRDLVERFHVPEERVRVIYPAIDADFQPVERPDELARFRAEHYLPERYLLFLGTLEPRKNLLGLVEAYARLRALDPLAPPLVIAGAKGWYHEAVFARVRTLGMEEHITFAGYISRKEQPLWYAAAEFFVYPSFYEGFGLPVAEALACGTPTITSSVSSMPEAGGSIATLVQPGDVDGLAHAMQSALANTSLRERSHREGPRFAARFSLANMSAAYVEVYHDAATLGRTRSGKRRR
jgi:glycosyltransferase involved in cell wall biosynthesis